jgi:hypothetical protein
LLSFLIALPDLNLFRLTKPLVRFTTYSLLFTKGKDVYYWQYAQGIKDEKTDKPDEMSISARFPKGNPLPHQIPGY